ncbi:YcnI family protein [Fontibacillus sp. BL9]|uniref:YcnI family copper-binding membrane protein n=1 Tax=Fontibacillus sp. BL9 TaxID=3389971 RepID=UPI003978966E
MKKLISRAVTLCSAVAAGLLLFSGLASAHVTVKPDVSAPGAWETYTIKIPVEKDIPTVKVSLKIPEGLDFKQYRPVPDWKVELTKNESGKVTVVTWSAEDEGIGPGEFQQFDFVGKNPAADASLAWDAFQYYSDGSIVEWSGEEGADTPHSITKVTADADAGSSNGSNSGHADHGHDNAGAANGAGTEAGADAGADSGTADSGAGNGAGANGAASGSGAENAAATSEPAGVAEQSGASATETATLVLSVAALLVSLAALWAALRSRKKTS